MPTIDCRLEDFKTRANGVQHLPVTPAEVLKTAAVVGMPTLASHPGRNRPLIEMIWRTALVSANVRPTFQNRRWTRSDAYDNLDPSEKTAVSYFLGMTQAAVTTRLVLGYPHLVHVDVLLHHQGVSLTGTRPDFVAVDPGNQSAYAAVVEAKGRTNKFDRDALRAAKRQTASTPTVRGLVPKEAIASEAYFDAGDHWSSVLADPVWDGRELNFGLETYLMLYYRNVIDAGREAPSWEQDNGAFRFDVPGLPLELQIPTAIVDAYDASRDMADDDQRDDNAPLLGAYRELIEASGTTGDLVAATITNDATEADLYAIFEAAPDDGDTTA
jgi:hypothetical protein